MDDGFTTLLPQSSVTPPSWRSSSIHLSSVKIDGVERLNLNSTLSWNGCIDGDAHEAEGGPNERVIRNTDEGLSQDVAVKMQRKDMELEVDNGFWSRDKRPKLDLPPVPTIGAIDLFSCTPCPATSHTSNSATQTSRPKPHPSHSWPPSSPTSDLHFSNPFGGIPPLTPPEEVNSFKWATQEPSVTPLRQHSLSSDQDSSRPEITVQQGSSSTVRPSTISLPGYANMPEQSSSPSTWLERAVNTIGKPRTFCNLVESALLTRSTVSSHTGASNERPQIQMVVQALPSQTKSPAGKPAFQEVAEHLQNQPGQVPYITITHAVSQVVSMEEVPASPPATPNQQENDDYFDNQTIFTHAAVVPNYHGQLKPTVPVAARPTGIIAAPSSIHISTLERYIPPTSGSEVKEFFDIKSRRSYLVDRLTELSTSNGTLLLVYPTQVGGAVFARQYIGPVLDPFLRQFVLLNNLTTDAAAALGKLAALPSLKTFEEMEVQLTGLCDELTQHAPRRGLLRGQFSMIYSEKVEVTLDRVTWLTWFIEQESARLRQDIVDYQKAGGRMPSRGFDASPGSLAREVIEGIKGSREEAGGVGIEVGVFVIRRSAL